MDLSIVSHIKNIPEYSIIGKVTAVKALTVEALGISNFVSLGSRCKIIKKDDREIFAEVISMLNDRIILMSFSDNEGIGIGCSVYLAEEQVQIYPDKSWLGRVINALGTPLDNNGPLLEGSIGYKINSPPPPAHGRNTIDTPLDVGIRAINSFLTCSYGQRMGIFAGSGVGKSVLLSMITRFAATDIKVIGLVGERGREVQEFLQKSLGEEGLAKSIVVVSTSDESALMRKQAAYLVLTIAEYFRDQGMSVLCMIDSATRFAMAQREIGLSAGEPATTKGYTPSVFTELPKLLERAGMGSDKGSITGLFTVLVEGDDNDEPVADNMRAILDGHIVLDRGIAERGRFPAINILRSISRTMMDITSDKEHEIIKKARNIILHYTDMEDMIRLGIYHKGSNPEVDNAIKYYPEIENFLSQKPGEYTNIKESFQNLASILDLDYS